MVIKDILHCFYDDLSGNPATSDTFRAEEIANSLQPIHLGDLEISRDATLGELKLQVMTLNKVSELPIPSVEFIRLRLREKDRLTLVLRDIDQTLR